MLVGWLIGWLARWPADWLASQLARSYFGFVGVVCTSSLLAARGWRGNSLSSSVVNAMIYKAIYILCVAAASIESIFESAKRLT